MNMQKSIAHYFQCLINAGEDMSFDLVKQKSSEREVFRFDHRQYDGMSALVEHLNQYYDQNPKSVPPLKIAPEPNFLTKFILLARWWFKTAYRSYYTLKKKGAATQALFDFRVIKVENEKNLSGKILWSLHQALGTQENSLWMLPVSLHEKVDFKLKPENKVSFIDMVVTKDDSLSALKKKLEKELKLKSYWGTQYTMLSSRILGEKLFHQMLKVFAIVLPRTGTLTNVGHWKIEGLPENEAWAIKATVVPITPVGASILQINNQLTLGLQLHACLGMNSQDLKQLLDRWETCFKSVLGKE